MTIKDGYQALGAITSLFGFISVLGAIYIMYSAQQLRKQTGYAKKHRAFFITDFVFWMSFCDVIQQAWISWSWLSVGFDASFNGGWSDFACKTTGFFAQYFLVGSASWNFVIAVSLLRILMGHDIEKFKNEIKYHHMFAWGVPFVTCIIPLFDDAYGYVSNIEQLYGFTEYECWITVKEYQLCLYAPAMIYVFFASILLLFTYYKVTRTNDINKSAAVSKRLTLYTIVFVVTWLFPILLRLRGIITTTIPDPWWVWAHHISISLIGTGNAVIWSSSQTLKDAKDKMKKNSKSKSNRSIKSGSRNSNNSGENNSKKQKNNSKNGNKKDTLASPSDNGAYDTSASVNASNYDDGSAIVPMPSNHTERQLHFNINLDSTSPPDNNNTTLQIAMTDVSNISNLSNINNDSEADLTHAMSITPLPGSKAGASPPPPNDT